MLVDVILAYMHVLFFELIFNHGILFVKFSRILFVGAHLVDQGEDKVEFIRAFTAVQHIVNDLERVK